MRTVNIIRMSKKVKIEITKEDGTKIKIEFPYNDPVKIFNYLKALEDIRFESRSSNYIFNEEDQANKIIDRVEDLIKNEFGGSFFTLSDIFRLYRLKYGEDIPKSTLSTYLNRLVEYGILKRDGRRGRYRYSLRLSL